MRRLLQLIPLPLIALLAVSCAGGEAAESDRIAVVATTTILGDLVENVGGDDVAVEVLTPVGADPHDFQASASQVAAINEADLVVANGLGLEEGLRDVLEAAVADGVRVFEVAPMLDPIPFGSEAEHEDHEEGEAEHEDHEEGEAEHEDHEEGEAEHEDHEEGEAEHEHEHGEDDPHVWFDPVRMAEGARLIAAQLAEVAPDTDWTARAEEYADQLVAADEEIIEMLSSIPGEKRRLVTNHGSLGYFADRYDFEVIGVVIPGGSTLGDPSSAELAALVEVMEHEGVGVIFAETTQPSDLADAVASELGEEVEVVDLYTGSLGEPGSGAETLIGMLTTNAERIAEALGG